MFSLFGPKSKLKKLQKQYETKVKEAYELSTVDRMKSDVKAAEAEKIAQEIDALVNQKK